jgi:hypothetical protein
MYIGDDSHFSSLLATLESHGLVLNGDKIQQILGADTTKNISTVLECATLGHKFGGGFGLFVGVLAGMQQIDKSNATVPKETPTALKQTPDATLLTLLSYCKKTNFSPDPHGTFYLEREWRCIGDFPFTPQDVEAVICPAAHMTELREKCTSQGCNASIIAWETLERV